VRAISAKVMQFAYNVRAVANRLTFSALAATRLELRKARVHDSYKVAPSAQQISQRNA